ncbi:MAG: formylglycine-generating enzyme family protein [Magnetococcus sp. DMHC-1]|nr:formylglycine-generating enzyme family protein [Magnetococcales bacterium]
MNITVTVFLFLPIRIMVTKFFFQSMQGMVSGRLLPAILCLLFFPVATGWSESPGPDASQSRPIKTYINKLGMEFVLIPAGAFSMGSDRNFDAEAFPDETPAHRVTISKPFYLGKHEVTQAQWVALMQDNPSKFKAKNLPVDLVGWSDVQEFIRRLNLREKTTTYRLPTEAEWEYACRAKSETSRFWGNRSDDMGLYAWYDGNSRNEMHPVGQLRPNAFGLYDMLGNVWEFVQDAYHEQAYSKHAPVDPLFEGSNANRVYRGGSWDGTAWYVRCSNRGGISREERFESLGFRVARSRE